MRVSHAGPAAQGWHCSHTSPAVPALSLSKCKPRGNAPAEPPPLNPEPRARRHLNCFSPNINLVRDPRWGRASETFGEDPLLTGRLASAYVRGLQGNHSHLLQVGALAPVASWPVMVPAGQSSRSKAGGVGQPRPPAAGRAQLAGCAALGLPLGQASWLRVQPGCSPCARPLLPCLGVKESRRAACICTFTDPAWPLAAPPPWLRFLKGAQGRTLARACSFVDHTGGPAQAPALCKCSTTARPPQHMVLPR